MKPLMADSLRKFKETWNLPGKSQLATTTDFSRKILNKIKIEFFEFKKGKRKEKMEIETWNGREAAAA